MLQVCPGFTHTPANHSGLIPSQKWASPQRLNFHLTNAGKQGHPCPVPSRPHPCFKTSLRADAYPNTPPRFTLDVDCPTRGAQSAVNIAKNARIVTCLAVRWQDPPSRSRPCAAQACFISVQWQGEYAAMRQVCWSRLVGRRMRAGAVFTVISWVWNSVWPTSLWASLPLRHRSSLYNTVWARNTQWHVLVPSFWH